MVGKLERAMSNVRKESKRAGINLVEQKMKYVLGEIEKDQPEKIISDIKWYFAYAVKLAKEEVG